MRTIKKFNHCSEKLWEILAIWIESGLTDNEGKLRNINVHGQCATKYLFALQRELPLCLANYNKVKYYTIHYYIYYYIHYYIWYYDVLSTTCITRLCISCCDVKPQHDKVGCKFFAKSAILEGTGVDLELKPLRFLHSILLILTNCPFLIGGSENSFKYLVGFHWLTRRSECLKCAKYFRSSRTSYSHHRSNRQC